MLRGRSCLFGLSLLLLSACRPGVDGTDKPESDSVARSKAHIAALAEAGAGIENAAFKSLLREHWANMLEGNPVHATELGVHDFDGRLRDAGPEARVARLATREDFLRRAQAIDASALVPSDQLSLSIFIDELDVGVRGDVCQYALWSMSPRDNALAQLNELAEVHPITTAEDAATLLARYQALPKQIQTRIADLRIGLSEGRLAPADSVRRVIKMSREELGKAPEQWSISLSADKGAAVAPELPGQVQALVRETLAREIEAYADFLEQEILPAARSDEQPGVMHVPDGVACYEVMIEEYTTMDRSADEIHQVGLDEMARINAEMVELGEKLFGTRDLPAILARLRTDPELFFATGEDVQAAAEASLARAKSRMPAFFGTLPQADCEVTPIPDYEAPFTYIAYYRQPVPDGSKPGQYFVNTYAPQTRPIYEARVLAVHESIPGHHLQIAIAQELEAIPAFRKHGGQTVFVEGWALYTERLGEEMGLYETDLDRMGVLSFDAWRAGRLVVDTGLHAKGWSRQDAIDYLTEHSALAPNNIDNEVDRYITWPGQALGYKMGQLAILEMREAAEGELGDRFEIGAFHDAILLGGAMPIHALRGRVDRYVAGTLAAAAE